MADARTDGKATVAITDDRVAMSADGDASILVETPDRQPLSATERHATIRVVGDDWRANVELNADQLVELATALTAAEETKTT